MKPKLICFYGPESTGKSTLALRIAERFKAGLVPEVARELISSNDFTAGDIVRIARAQTARVLEMLKKNHRIVFCDTDVITTGIYSQTYLGVIPPELVELEKEVHYDQYFLFDVDVPWVADGLRDLGEKRPEMFEHFKAELDRRSIPYIVLSGTHKEREDAVTRFVESLLLKE